MLWFNIYDSAYEYERPNHCCFIIDHRIYDMHNIDISLVFLVLWRLYFDGWIHNNGQGVGVVYIYPYGTILWSLMPLKIFFCTIIKAEYAMLFGLDLLGAIGATHIEALGDSLWVVQQISKGHQYFDKSLIVYLEVSLDIKFTLGCFNISHISRHENWRANELAQQAFGYHVDHGVLHIYQ